MKFGRVPPHTLPQVVFDLPDDSGITGQVLEQAPISSRNPSVYVGCSVWADRSFIGKLYPPKLPPKDFLSHYCQHFNTVELNATFYAIPSAEQVKKWEAVATPGFKFCPKISRSISHRTQLDLQPQLLERFIDAVLQFGDALGMAFLQLPPYFQPSHMPSLQRFLSGIPYGFPLAVEFRHPAWFTDLSAQRAMFAFLRERDIATVITDVAGRRDVLHQTLTTHKAFIRFVGNSLHPTDYERIDRWVERLQDWLAQGLEAVYFLLHEPEKALCVDLAAYMVKRLNAFLSTPLSPPQPLDVPATLFGQTIDDSKEGKGLEKGLAER